MKSLLPSHDPLANLAIVIVAIIAAVMVVALGGMLLLPVVIVFAIGKGIHWYVNRPTPTDQLYAVAQQRTIAANFPDPEKFLDAYLDRFLEALHESPPSYHLYMAMAQIAGRLYSEESLHNPLPPLQAASAIEEGRYRDQVLAHQRKTLDAPRTLRLLHETLGSTFVTFSKRLPPIVKSTPEELSKCGDVAALATFPLVDMLPDLGRSVSQLTAPFFAAGVSELGLFSSLRAQLDYNRHIASGLTHSAAKGKLIAPDEYDGPAEEIVTAYLHDTPLEAIFQAQIPFNITDQQRYEHAHVVGGSGHGKTQLLQRLILTDLQRGQPPALVIVDSQGEMLRKIQRLDLFAPGKPLADRIVIIDPEDVEHPPALNMFDTNPSRIGSYSQTIKEQIEASTIEIFNYVFGALAAELTSRQNTTFAFVTRLLLSIPGATIHTLRHLFEDGATSIDASPFADYIRKLDPTSQAYFENQFFTKTYTQTKQQIARRLYSVLQVPAFDRMFASKVNRLDVFEALQRGSVILINTSKALLKTDASALFGRYMIARVIAAAFERIAVPNKERTPAFLIVDEAAEYFDDNLETLLSQARKFNLGVVFAHQHLDQLTPSLRAAVAANTSIKLAGGVSDRDARALAADMRTTPDFISSMQKRDGLTEFACYVRNYTSNALRLAIPFGALEKAPRLSAEQHAQLRGRNRERYSNIGGNAPEPRGRDERHVRLHSPNQSQRFEKAGATSASTNPDAAPTDAAKTW